jgi:hypothetical protein
VENKLSEEQYGFRDDRSVVDSVFTMRQILGKRWEFGRDKCLPFVDIEKACDNTG